MCKRKKRVTKVIRMKMGSIEEQKQMDVKRRPWCLMRRGLWGLLHISGRALLTMVIIGYEMKYVSSVTIDKDI